MVLDDVNPSLLFFAIVPVVWCVKWSGMDMKAAAKESSKDEEPQQLEGGVLDIRRKCQIATGRVMDHRHDAVLRRKLGLDLDRTIFANVKSPVARYSLEQQLGWDAMWSDASISRIESLYGKVPQCPPIPQHLLRFMEQHCDFLVEHADGSFMDHLRFLHDFAHTWYTKDKPGAGSAPIVMLLHSIAGLGTNFFPMEASKLPQLEQLLSSSPGAFHHIAAFPSFLRLLKQRSFIRHLQTSPRTPAIKAVTLHRIIDNAPITFTSQQMWVALNYQLIHSIDFLPLTHLAYNSDHVACPKFGLHHPDSPFLSEYFELYHLLESKNKLFVDLKPIQFFLSSSNNNNNNNNDSYYCPPPQPSGNVYSFVKRMLPAGLVSNIVERITYANIQRFSDQIGHSLAYEFTYVEE